MRRKEENGIILRGRRIKGIIFILKCLIQASTWVHIAVVKVRKYQFLELRVLDFLSKR